MNELDILLEGYDIPEKSNQIKRESLYDAYKHLSQIRGEVSSPEYINELGENIYIKKNFPSLINLPTNGEKYFSVKSFERKPKKSPSWGVPQTTPEYPPLSEKGSDSPSYRFIKDILIPQLIKANYKLRLNYDPNMDRVSDIVKIFIQHYPNDHIIYYATYITEAMRGIIAHYKKTNGKEGLNIIQTPFESRRVLMGIETPRVERLAEKYPDSCKLVYLDQVCEQTESNRTIASIKAVDMATIYGETFTNSKVDFMLSWQPELGDTSTPESVIVDKYHPSNSYLFMPEVEVYNLCLGKNRKKELLKKILVHSESEL